MKEAIPGFMIIIMLLMSGMGLAAGKAGGPPAVQFPDESVRGTPWIVYPDQKAFSDIAGSMKEVLSAKGDYSFSDKYSKTKVSLNLKITVQYNRSLRSETIITTVEGFRQENYDTSTGTHRVTKDTFTGSNSRDEKMPLRITSIFWSKQLNLACFQACLGAGGVGMQAVVIEIPAKWRQTIDDNQGHYEQNREFMFQIWFPSQATSNSRFARLVNPGGGLLGGWIETPSGSGNSNGSFSVPVFAPDTLGAWYTERTLKEGGTDPRKTPLSKTDIFWQGSLEVTWELHRVGK